MMSLLRAALRSNSAVSTLQKSHGLPFLLWESPKRFSTEAERPPEGPTADEFLQAPESGLAYGRLMGIREYTLKTDVINIFEECNLTLEDVKMEYNRDFSHRAMMLQFPSQATYAQALRMLRSKNLPYRLDRADRSQWDLIVPYDGRTILVKGLPRAGVANMDEIERFMYGCKYDPSSISVFVRPGDGEPVRMATVRFPTKIEAMNAFITKNGAFCVNNQVSVRVLQ